MDGEIIKLFTQLDAWFQLGLIESITTNDIAAEAWFHTFTGIPPETLRKVFRAAIAKYAKNEQLSAQRIYDNYFLPRLTLEANAEWRLIIQATAAPDLLAALDVLANLSPQGELALEDVGGIKLLREEKTEKYKSETYAKQNFVKFWLSYHELLRNGEIEPPAKRLPPAPKTETREEKILEGEAAKAAREKMLKQVNALLKSDGAKSEWDLIVQAAISDPLAASHILEGLSPQGKLALDKMGGLAVFNGKTPDDYQKLFFVEFWADYEDLLQKGEIESPSPFLPPPQAKKQKKLPQGKDPINNLEFSGIFR